jgi:hypothetical protein
MSAQTLELAEVTLVAVTSVAIEPTARAVARSLDLVRFGRALWISDQAPPPLIADRVEWIAIGPISSRAAFSEFMLRHLAGHVSSSHALCVQWDGYVLDPQAWDPAFLDHDYIGAPWPHFADGHRVGNGGFSLRSRRLLACCTQLPVAAGEPEDVAICRVWRPVLEQRHSIRFASEELATAFAYERSRPPSPTFGFHGVFNLVNQLNKSESRALLASLEESLLASNERRELLGQAIRGGNWGMAWNMLRRILRARS